MHYASPFQTRLVHFVCSLCSGPSYLAVRDDQQLVEENHVRTTEEDTDEQEADSSKDEADEVRPMKTTPNFGKKAEIIEEHSKERGVSMSVQATKTPPNADIAAKSATTKKSAERRSTNRFPQADNSRITPQTMKTMAECS